MAKIVLKIVLYLILLFFVIWAIRALMNTPTSKETGLDSIATTHQ